MTNKKIWTLEEALQIFPVVKDISEEFFQIVEEKTEKIKANIMPENEMESLEEEIKKLKLNESRREISLARSHSKPQRDPSLSVGLKDDDAIKVAKQLNQYGQRTGWFGSAGEGDNRKAVHLVKWMNTGKKRNGTHYCR